MSERAITNDDLYAAIRGLGMWSAEDGEVEAIMEQHKGDTLFAGRVIHEAARQVLQSRRENFRLLVAALREDDPASVKVQKGGSK